MTDIPRDSRRLNGARRGFWRPSRVAMAAIVLVLAGAVLIVAGWLAPPPPVAELQTQVVVDLRR